MKSCNLQEEFAPFASGIFDGRGEAGVVSSWWLSLSKPHRDIEGLRGCISEAGLQRPEGSSR